MSTRKAWTTAPISPTCETLSVLGEMGWEGPITEDKFCGEATTYAYPAMGGGWMAMCEKHADKHLCDGGTRLVEELIDEGEVWDFGDTP